MISAALRKSMILWTMVGYRKENSAISWFQPQMLLRTYVNKGLVGGGGRRYRYPARGRKDLLPAVTTMYLRKKI